MSYQYLDLLDKDSQVSNALRKLDLVNKNPASVQQISLELLDQFLSGEEDLVDATNPFMKLLECSAVNAASFIVDNEVSTRQQYESCAQTYEDLYHHMSDKDYIDRFASPAKTKFKIVVPMTQLREAMVLDPATGIKKVTIPRNSEFILNEYIFSIQYPIDIKELAHGGLQVVYDTSKISPLETLATNVVEYEVKKIKELDDAVLFMEVDVGQFTIKSKTHELTSAKLFRKTYTFNDQYYYARVFFKNNANNNEWVEMKTTHTDQVYDINEPTAVLKVLNNELEVYIPQIYFTTDLISGGVRVDIYQTKGEISVSLDTFKPSSFKGRWIAIDKADQTKEVAAWTRLPDVFIYSSNTVYGGKDQISFETLRNRVMMNAIGDRNLPITNAQITAFVENKGFDIVKNVDLVTNRIFQATRAMPKPFDEKLITAAATSVESVIIKMDDLTSHPAVHNNDTRMTLSPDLLYQNVNGIIKVVPPLTVIDLLNKNPDTLALEVTEGNYLYTPFHYVLDTNEKDFKVRPYYMNKPEFEVMEFVDQNDSTMLQVNTKRFSITRTNYGYQVLVETKSNAAYRDIPDNECFIQMSFIPEYEASRVYLNGEFVKRTDENEKVFKFDIYTNFDIDSRNVFYLNSFEMENTINTKFGSKLKQKFDFVYGTTAIMGSGYQVHEIDNLLGKFKLPFRATAITHEKADFVFGQYLKYLWTSNRTLANNDDYEKWDTDVPALYEENVYEIDPITGSIFSIGTNGNLVYNILHNKGDPVLDTNGKPVMKHKKGDVKKDSNGNPIILNPKYVTRLIDLMFVEGAYYFSTDPSSTVYRESFVNTVVNWITQDIAKMNESTLEQTEVYFYPKTNMSSISVMVNNSNIINVNANQSFNVQVYVKKHVYENTALCLALTTATIKAIDEHLKSETVAISDIISDLKVIYNEDVISFSIKGLGGNLNLDTLTVLSKGDRCSIRKRLSNVGDGKLIVREDVNVEFIRHDLS